jgi:hypothetical protein
MLLSSVHSLFEAKEREIEENVGGQCETLHLTGDDRSKFTNIKDPRQCTLVFLVKGGVVERR